MDRRNVRERRAACAPIIEKAHRGQPLTPDERSRAQECTQAAPAQINAARLAVLFSQDPCSDANATAQMDAGSGKVYA